MELRTLYSVGLLALSSGILTDAARDCIVDVLFVFDTSSSERGKFGYEVQLADEMVKYMQLGREKSHRVAAIEFWNTQQTIVDWGESQDTRSELIQKLDGMQYIGGRTMVAEAMRYALDNLIRGRRRPNADLLVILLHDGVAQDNAESISRQIRDLPNAYIFAVGINEAREVNREALARISGDPQMVVTGRSFSEVRSPGIKGVYRWLECRGEPGLEPTYPYTTETELTPYVDPEVDCMPDEEGYGYHGEGSECSVDVLFIFDTSTSERGGFRDEIRVADDLINTMDLGRTGRHRVAAVEFSGNNELETIVDWGRNQESIGELRTQIDNMKYYGGKTLLARALRYAVDRVILGRRRPDAKLVTIILHDGITYDLPVPVAREIRSMRNSVVAAVGVSDGRILRDKLIELTGDEGLVVTGRDYETVQYDVQQKILPLLACDDCEPVLPPCEPVEEDYGEKKDFLFIVDTSTSEQKSFREEQVLVERLVEQMDLRRHRVGVVEFSGKNRLETIVNWGEHQNSVYELVNRLETMKYFSGSTYVGRALRYAYDYMIRTGRRPEADLVVVLIHDGLPTDDPVPAAIRIRGEPRTTLIGVGMSKNRVNRRVLDQITGNPRNVFTGRAYLDVYDGVRRAILP